MSDTEKFKFFHHRKAHELVKLAQKFILEKQINRAISAYQSAITEYKQHLISLKYIEEEINFKINELIKTVQKLKANLIAPQKETTSQDSLQQQKEREENQLKKTTISKEEAEREIRRIVYQAKKSFDDFSNELKKGIDFTIIKQKVEETCNNFKTQIKKIFGNDLETIKVYLKWLDNLINELQITLLEQKSTKTKEEPLPLKKTDESKIIQQKEETKKMETEKKLIGAGYKILVIDDEPDVVTTLEFLLKNEGFSVFTALNGEEGLNSLRDNHPDLVILDIKMPGMSGYEVAQTIKEDPEFKKTPIIFLTAVSQVVDPTFGIKTEIQADRYVSKPYDIDNFLKIIKELLKINDGSNQEENSN